MLIKETEKPKGDEANAKKTEQGVDGLTFCLSCSNWYVSCYVRYHWCILFLVGGEGVGEGEGDDERFQYGPTTNLSNENLSGIFLFIFILAEENIKPRPSMLSSTTSVPTSETFVQDTCLRKRHKGDQNKEFCCDSKTADPFSMSTAGNSNEIRQKKKRNKVKGKISLEKILIAVASFSEKGGPIRHHQSPLPPIFARLSTSEVGRAKKDDNWLVRNHGNFLPFSQKGEWNFYENATFICFPVNYDSGLSFEVVDTFLSLQPVA